MNRAALPLLLLSALPGAALAQAQGAVQPLQVSIVEPPLPDRPNRLSLNPVGALLGLGSFAYERALTDRFSVSVLPSFMYWGFGDDKLYGGALGLGAAFYVSGKAPEGFRASLEVTPGFVSVAPDGRESTSAFMLNGRAMLGYNWIWHSGFTLGLGAGVQYLHIGIEDVDALNGVLPALDFNLGFVF